MRVGFAGTTGFAARALAAIAAAGHTIPVVLTRPDKPKGRGMKVDASPVKALAESLGLPLLQPFTLKDEAARLPALAIPLDVLVVAAYGLLLPPGILDWPRHGCINIHASRLPRWRGAAPIQRAIEAGDALTGVSIMRMDAGLDTGPVVTMRDVPILRSDTGGSLTGKLADAGALAIVDALAALARDQTLRSTPQSDDGISYARKVDASERAVEWSRTAREIERKLRAFDPVPGASSTIDGRSVKLWSAEVRDVETDAPSGTVVAVAASGVDVACGPGAVRGLVRLTEVQPAGGRRMPVAAWLAGHAVSRGSRFS